MNYSWSSVYAYAWSGSTKNASWPGEKINKFGTSKNGYAVYKVTFDMDKYGNIIFNSGSSSNQTVDIPLSGKDTAFRISGSSNGKYTVSEVSLSDIM